MKSVRNFIQSHLLSLFFISFFIFLLFQVYLALAKGGLTPDHALLLPVAHHQSTSDMPASIQKELNQYPLIPRIVLVLSMGSPVI